QEKISSPARESGVLPDAFFSGSQQRWQGAQPRRSGFPERQQPEGVAGAGPSTGALASAASARFWAREKRSSQMRLSGSVRSVNRSAPLADAALTNRVSNFTSSGVMCSTSWAYA